MMDKYLQSILDDTRLINMLNTIFDGIYIVDNERNIIFWNKGAEQITGYQDIDVAGKKCSANILNHIDEDGKLLCNSGCPLAETILTGENKIAKVYPKHKDNTRFPVQTHIAPIRNNEGVIVGGIEVFRDISKEEDLKILQEKFNSLIQKYISNTAYEEIMSQITHGKSEVNTLKDMTILYMDVVDFTGISEKMEPNNVAQLLNDLFGMCDVITRECQGDIDKFIGDSIMATFIDANDAILAANKILIALQQFNFDRNKQGLKPITLHFGINSGNVIQVEVGTQDRKDFTVIGDTVNTAARIESISEPDTIYISEATYSRLKNQQAFELVGEKKLRGKDGLIKVFRQKIEIN